MSSREPSGFCMEEGYQEGAHRWLVEESKMFATAMLDRQSFKMRALHEKPQGPDYMR